MISRAHIEAGCVFEPEVQAAEAKLGFVHSHVDLALDHLGTRGIDISIDPDGFVIMNQLRFASLVARSIPTLQRRTIPLQEREIIFEIPAYLNHVTKTLLKEGLPCSTQQKAAALAALRIFDHFTLQHAEMVESNFHKVEAALELEDQYGRLGILNRLARLKSLHPDKKLKRSIDILLDSFLSDALNYVGTGRTKSPDELSAILLTLVSDDNEDWRDFPSSLKPHVLDQWIRRHEEGLLSLLADQKKKDHDAVTIRTV